MHSNVMLRFMVHTLQDPPLCRSIESVRQSIARLELPIPLKNGQRQLVHVLYDSNYSLCLCPMLRLAGRGETRLRQHGVSSCDKPSTRDQLFHTDTLSISFVL
jgi:hypothetical protein